MDDSERASQNLEAFEKLLKATGGRGNIVLTQIYLTEAAPAWPNEWYFSARCNGCGKIAPIIEDVNKGVNTATFSGEGKIRIACPHCQEEILAGAQDIFSAEWLA